MIASLPTKPRKYACFCGIDIAKNKHVACVVDRDGKLIVRSQSFTNDAEGYQRILDRLKEVGGPSKVSIAMEATGHYWYSLHDFLIRHHYDVAVLNPIQTAKQVTIARDPDWWGEPAKLDRVVFRTLDPDAVVSSFANGEVDVAGEERIVAEDHDVVSTRTSVTGAEASIRARGDGSPRFQWRTTVPAGTVASKVAGTVSDPLDEVTFTRVPSAMPMRVRSSGFTDSDDDPARPASIPDMVKARKTSRLTGNPAVRAASGFEPMA